jgi:hypothetical protein
MVRSRLLSGASDGLVRAVLTKDLIVAGDVYLRQGTTLLGTGTSGEERLMIKFAKLVFKNGQSMRTSAIACDPADKIPGIKGSDVRGQSARIAGAIGLGFLGGAAMGMQKDQSENEDPSTRDAMLNGVSVASLEQARSMTEDIKNTRPKIEVERGTEFYVMFEGDE